MPRSRPLAGIAVGRCYNSSVMDESKVRNPDPLESSPGADGPAETVEELRKQVEEKQDRLLRALAEAENFKRRTQRERDESVRYANESLLRDLIPVLDNLERCLHASREEVPLLEGVRLVHLQLLRVMADFGLERVSAMGQRFDPVKHDALAVVPIDDPAKDGVVIRELEPAYVFGERVIRPAKVEVGRSARRPTM